MSVCVFMTVGVYVFVCVFMCACVYVRMSVGVCVCVCVFEFVSSILPLKRESHLVWINPHFPCFPLLEGCHAHSLASDEHNGLNPQK